MICKKAVSYSLWLQLNDAEPLDTFTAQLLIKINSALHPPLLRLDHEIRFSGPHVLPNPMPPSDDASYQFLLSRATKPKDLNATLVIEAVRVPEPEVVASVCMIFPCLFLIFFFPDNICV